jgi:formate--tetrahydrofolate ligase
MERGFDNFDKHIEHMKYFGFDPLVAINRFLSDTDAELEMLLSHCKSQKISAAINESWASGGEGADCRDNNENAWSAKYSLG